MKKSKRGRKRVNYMHPAVVRALKKSGGTLETLAAKIGITPQAVAMWGPRIPIDHVAMIEKLSGVPREKLRPDVFGRNRNI